MNILISHPKPEAPNSSACKTIWGVEPQATIWFKPPTPPQCPIMVVIVQGLAQTRWFMWKGMSLIFMPLYARIQIKDKYLCKIYLDGHKNKISNSHRFDTKNKPKIVLKTMPNFNLTWRAIMSSPKWGRISSTKHIAPKQWKQPIVVQHDQEGYW